MINLVHYLFLPDLRFILASFYYVYNIGIFLIIAFLFNKKPFQSRDAILIFLYVAIAIEFLVIIFAPEVRAGREIGTFNNPNQLSAWSLMSICIIIALRYHDQLRFIDLIFIVLLCLMQLSTLSKAGIISTALLIAPLSLSKIIPFNYKILSIFLIFIGLFYMVISNNYIFKKVSEYALLANAYDQVNTLGQDHTDNPEGRGYARIVEHPYYLIFGAGEGGYDRFSTDMHPKARELHSGLGTLFFCYGLFGAALFFTFLFGLYRNTPLLILYTLGIILMYGLVHQQMRFSMFWVYLGAVYGYSRIIREPNEANLPSETQISFERKMRH